MCTINNDQCVVHCQQMQDCPTCWWPMCTVNISNICIWTVLYLAVPSYTLSTNTRGYPWLAVEVFNLSLYSTSNVHIYVTGVRTRNSCLSTLSVCSCLTLLYWLTQLSPKGPENERKGLERHRLKVVGLKRKGLKGSFFVNKKNLHFTVPPAVALLNLEKL